MEMIKYPQPLHISYPTKPVIPTLPNKKIKMENISINLEDCYNKNLQELILKYGLDIDTLSFKDIIFKLNKNTDRYSNIATTYNIIIQNSTEIDNPGYNAEMQQYNIDILKYYEGMEIYQTESEKCDAIIKKYNADIKLYNENQRNRINRHAIIGATRFFNVNKFIR